MTFLDAIFDEKYVRGVISDITQQAFTAYVKRAYRKDSDFPFSDADFREFITLLQKSFWRFDSNIDTTKNIRLKFQRLSEQDKKEVLNYFMDYLYKLYFIPYRDDLLLHILDDDYDDYNVYIWRALLFKAQKNIQRQVNNIINIARKDGLYWTFKKGFAIPYGRYLFTYDNEINLLVVTLKSKISLNCSCINVYNTIYKSVNLFREYEIELSDSNVPIIDYEYRTTYWV